MSTLSRQLLSFAFVTAFAVCGAMPQQHTNANVIGGLADCDTTQLHLKWCTAVAGQNCTQKLKKCTATNGQELRLICTSGGGSTACGAAACVNANEDKTSSNCNRVAP